MKVFASIYDKEQVGSVRTKPKDDIINDIKVFGQLRVEEIEGLLKHNTYKFTNVHDVMEGTRVFQSGLIDSVKIAKFGVKYRSRSVKIKYGDHNAETIAIKSPTAQRFS